MKAMLIRKFLVAALVFCVGSGSAQPSKDEFNLFCRILAWADDMLLEPEFVYDKEKDNEVVKEMTVLYNATTDNMDNFRKTLWDTKDFFEAHPPPTQPENRKKAHNEIGNLIREGEEKIMENRKIAVEVNEKIEQAKLSVLQGIYGDGVKNMPKQDGNFTEILGDTGSIFNSNITAKESCGHEKEAGKTLINDFFCVCVGEGIQWSEPPCHGKLQPPKKVKCGLNDCCKSATCCECGKWNQMKHEKVDSNPLSLSESFEKIENVCRDLLEGQTLTKKIPTLLDEYVGMIGKGDDKVKTNKSKRIFGHSGRPKGIEGKGQVTECAGAGNYNYVVSYETHNNNICVDYTRNLHGKTYDIPWHNKFREAAEKMDQAKKIEERILKSRAALLLLKSQAWVAYSREKDDETSNLDDMNVSNLFDATQLPPSFPLPFLFLLS